LILILAKLNRRYYFRRAKPSNGPESTKQNAIKKYGNKAPNGIIIETKEFQKNNNFHK
jgi:hypothetical protein